MSAEKLSTNLPKSYPYIWFELIMKNSTKSKHAILAAFKKQKLKDQDQAYQQIERWYQQRDYSFITSLSSEEYVKELEMRLHILQTITFNAFYISPPPGNELQIWKHSCSSGATRLMGQVRIPEAPRRKLVEAEKVENLKFRYELAQHYQEILPPLHADATLEEIDAHAVDSHRILKQREYICPLAQHDKRTMLSIDLAGGSDEEILAESLHIITTLRKQLEIAGPPKVPPLLRNKKQARKNTSLKPYLKSYAIQYLDLLMYCIQPHPFQFSYCIKSEVAITSDQRIEYRKEEQTAHIEKLQENNKSLRENFVRPQPGYMWDLSDSQLAKIINSDDLDGDHIRQWRKDTYEPSLFNGKYISSLILHVKTQDAL
ncbi:hypothetical protein FDM56_14125 [Vibrio cholerae]|nr:hypothetical protein [Vibrio cholerae]